MIDLSPLAGLRLRTPRLELRWPGEEELVALAHVAERGVHPPEEMPFLVPWTDGIGGPSFVDDFVAYHLSLRRDWTPAAWALELAVWAEGGPAGCQGVTGTDFRRERRVVTGSWLGRAFQRRGYGTEMRAAVLELSFGGLGALAAESGALDGNLASERVSAKLGYVLAGEATRSPRGEPVRERLFRLDRARRRLPPRPPVEIVGLDACLPLFGLA